MDIISELPDDVLRKILYFLSQEEAARTSVLSKPWRYIWCTRPNLDFSYTPPTMGVDYNRFRAENKIKKQEFISAVDATLRRYRDNQSACAEEFRLSMSLDNSNYDPDRVSVSFLEKWVPSLVNMVTKEFHLSIVSERYPGRVELPPVVWGCEPLRYLYLEKFLLDQKAIERIVPLKNLKSLGLQEILIEDDTIFGKIISNCPSIENLDVHGFLSLKTIKVSDDDLHNLKNVNFSFDTVLRDVLRELRIIEIHHSSLETINIGNANICFGEGAGFLNLKYLNLGGVKSPLGHLSSYKFPSLENLEFHDCDGLKGSEVLFIDAPNIVYFEFSGEFIPSISIATTSEEWESCIDIPYVPGNNNDDPLSFFIKLKQLLESLSDSEIYLTGNHSMHFNDYVIPENIRNGCDGGNKYVVVENLILNFHLSSVIPSLLNRFLSICRPRNVVN
ncbi:hypothetical protein MIMGU_mgv1a024012mg, partial [Erythranthe guttata]